MVGRDFGSVSGERSNSSGERVSSGGVGSYVTCFNCGEKGHRGLVNVRRVVRDPVGVVMRPGLLPAIIVGR